MPSKLKNPQNPDNPQNLKNTPGCVKLNEEQRHVKWSDCQKVNVVEPSFEEFSLAGSSKKPNDVFHCEPSYATNFQLVQHWMVKLLEMFHRKVERVGRIENLITKGLILVGTSKFLKSRNGGQAQSNNTQNNDEDGNPSCDLKKAIRGSKSIRYDHSHD